MAKYIGIGYLLLLISLYANGVVSNKLSCGPEKCPATGSTIMPFPDDCTLFIYCNNGIKIVESCQEGLHFNPNTFNCDWPDIAGCVLCVPEITEAPTTKEPTTEDPTTEEPIIEEPTISTTTDEHESTCEMADCPDLPPNQFIFLPVPWDCELFVMCLNGEAIEMSCSPGIIFDEQVQTCVIPSIENQCIPCEVELTTLEPETTEEELTTEKLTTEEPTTEETTTEEPTTEEHTTEDPITEEPITDEPSTEEPTTEETTTNVSTTTDSTTEEPTTEEPTTEEQTTEEPTTEEPITDEPTTEEPTTDEPTTEEPTTEEQTTEEPTTEEFTTDEPTTEKQTTEEPTTEEPITDEPITEEPTTEEPTTEEPITDEPTTEEPTTEEPTTEEPTTEEPTTEEPTTEEPTTEEQTTEEPTTEEPTTKEPITDEPTTEEPTTEEPITDEPTTEESTTEEPTTEEPTTKEPTTEEPITEEPTTEEPTTDGPTTTDAPESMCEIADCPDLPQNEFLFLPVPWDCSKYVMCMNGDVIQLECPAGQIFDEQAQGCYTPSIENECIPCELEPTTEAPTTEEPTTEELITEAPTTEVLITEEPTTDGPTTTDEPESTCEIADCPDLPQNEFLFLPVPWDCNIYVMCMNGDVIPLECPAGQIFDEQTQECDIPSIENECIPCEREETTEAPTTEEPTTEESITEEPTTEVPTTEVPITEEPTTDGSTTTNEPESTCEIADCPDLPQNEFLFLPVPWDCNKYVMCMNGDVIQLECPAGQIFDEQAQGCYTPSIENECIPCELEPTTEAPTTEEPTTEESITEEPTTEVPITEEPTTTDEPESSCKITDCPDLPQNEFLFLPVPWDCNKYVMCMNGDVIQLECPAGQIFDEQAQGCYTPSIENECIPCEMDLTTLVPETTTEEPITTDEPGSTCEIADCPDLPQNEFLFLPVPWDCSKYVMCMNGEIFEIVCPSDQIFDEQAQGCATPTIDNECIPCEVDV